MTIPHPPSNRLLVTLTIVVALFGLYFARPVALPLAFAVFLIALLWPLEAWLARRMPPTVAFVATLLTLAAGLWAFGWILTTTASAAIDRWPQYQPRFDELAETWKARAESWGLSLGDAGGGSGSSPKSPAEGAAHGLVSFIEGALLTLALTVLGLHEVEAFRDKVAGFQSPEGARVIAVGRRCASRFGRYFYTRTVMGLIQGVATGLFAWAVGLDLPFVWGVLSALLNYIPTIGSVLAVVPPSLFALVQFPQTSKALLVVGGLAAVQIILGNYVDPRIQGRWLSLSPVVVLLSVAFWGWFWGPAGALIAVPITLALVVAGEEFPSLRPLSVLLAERKKDEGT